MKRINNKAGIIWVGLRKNKRANESQLAVNYLAPFHLTSWLWPTLKKAQRASVINVTSQGHPMAPFDLEDPNFEHRANETLLGYGQSKSAVNLFTLELDHRAKALGISTLSPYRKRKKIRRSLSGKRL